jgi:hypothetical protein
MSYSVAFGVLTLFALGLPSSFRLQRCSSPSSCTFAAPKAMRVLKRLLTFVDCAAILIAILFLFAVVVIGVRGAAVAIWQLAREMYAAHGDWWIVAGILFSLAWSAIRLKAALRTLDD